MIHGVHHTAISTGNLERAVDFYTGLLGFQMISRFDWQQGNDSADAVTGLKNSAAQAAMLKLGNAFLELFEYQAPAPRTVGADRPVCDHGITHIALQVDDLEAEYRRLSAAGMRFHCAPISGFPAVYGRDPDGNVVELMQVAEDSPMRLDHPG